MKSRLPYSYDEVISSENILIAWQEFVRGKRGKHDVQIFAFHLMDNIVQLHDDLANKTYCCNGYESFRIADPKLRHIHKASVRDRLLYHAVYRMLHPFFDKIFISDSYSCRINKGTHKAGLQFRCMAGRVSRNNTRTSWALQCDIKKFFSTIDQQTLITILQRYIPDQNILWLLQNIITSFGIEPGRGLPLGNLTSQLFVNLYMNEFDQFVKHRLKARFYIRYADDFVILSENKQWLQELISKIKLFLSAQLHLELHPQKVTIKTLASGVDFLGWVYFPTHRVLRTATRRRMMRRVQKHATNETLQSYLGLLKHGNTHKIRQEVLNEYWLWQNSTWTE